MASEPAEPALSRAQLIAEATEIAAQLRQHVRRTPKGSVTWVGPAGYGSEQSPLVLQQFGPDIHHGTTGVALFLAAAALAQDGGTPGDIAGELRQLSLDAVAPLRRKLAAMVADPDPAAAAKPLRLGGLKGLGSFIYGLLTLGELTGETALLDEAHRATSLITASRIAQDTQVRMQTGCAGTILALLALHARQPGANAAGRTPLDLARDCARHLLATRVSHEGGPRVWALSPGKPPVIGFCYGAAGISHALLRLYGATGDRELQDAAREGLAYVRAHYSPARGNWLNPRALFEARHRLRRGTWLDWWYSGTPDDVEPADPRQRTVPDLASGDHFLRMWCHGSSGILLGKMATLDLDDSAEVREEIRDGLEDLCRGALDGAPADTADTADTAETPDGAAGEADDLCCGQMGHVEALLYAHDKLGNARCLAAAQRSMAQAWRRRQREGRYRLSAARGSDLFSPSLFQGVAGVGYACLRLAMPRRLPCLPLLA